MLGNPKQMHLLQKLELQNENKDLNVHKVLQKSLT